MSNDPGTTLKFPASATGDHPVGQLQLTDNSLLIDCDVKMAVGIDPGKHLVSWRKTEVDLVDVLDVYLRVQFKSIKSVRNQYFRNGAMVLLPLPIAFMLCLGVVLPLEGAVHALVVIGLPLLLIIAIVGLILLVLSIPKRRIWPVVLYQSNGIEFRTREGTGLALSGRAPIPEQEAFVALVRQAIRRSHEGGMN